MTNQQQERLCKAVEDTLRQAIQTPKNFQFLREQIYAVCICLDDPVEPEPTAPTVVKPKLLTKIVSVNGDSNGASKDEITLKYDANSRISSTIYDGITYNYTYGTNTIDVKYKNDDGEDRTIAYVLKDGKVVSKTSSYSKYTFDYASGKLQEYKEFDVDDNGNEDLEDDYKLTWSGANVTKIAKEGRSYEVTYSTIKGGSVAAALFLFGGGEVGHFPLDVDEIRRNAPVLDKMGDMPEYLPSMVVETREYEDEGQLKTETTTYTFTYTQNGEGLITALKVVADSTNEKETTNYTLTWK